MIVLNIFMCVSFFKFSGGWLLCFVVVLWVCGFVILLNVYAMQQLNN